ncbi:MAG: hypothetical protein ACNS62_16655 [Candidatus Cyclobacteriaceae bacterium M3_2C_046]
MAIIKKKKIIYKISNHLRNYLVNHNREHKLTVSYADLKRYESSIPLYDSRGTDTLWETVFFPQSEMKQIYDSLKFIYALIKADGDLSVIEHLYIDRVDICTYGNTRPFRVRIVNKINDLFDYYYVKVADASRIYGLEIEHLLSPNKINYIVCDNTLIEEHIQGIPGDDFIKYNLKDDRLNEIRLAKEFVKFNERCLVRLLGDMHSSNFVVEVIPDFDEIHYRIRAIDFDQQSYEGRRAIYMPQYFKQNNPIILLGLKHMAPELEMQYQKEERSLIATRFKSYASRQAVMDLLASMSKDEISPPDNINQLKQELAQLYQDDNFLQCKNMGDILKISLEMVLSKPIRKKYAFIKNI